MQSFAKTRKILGSKIQKNFNKTDDKNTQKYSTFADIAHTTAIVYGTGYAITTLGLTARYVWLEYDPTQKNFVDTTMSGLMLSHMMGSIWPVFVYDCAESIITKIRRK